MEKAITVAILAMVFGKGVVAAPASSTTPAAIATAILETSAPSNITVANATGSIAAATAPINSTASASLLEVPSTTLAPNISLPIPTTSGEATFVTQAAAAATSTVTITKYFVPEPHSIRPHPPWAANGGFVHGLARAEPDSEGGIWQKVCRNVWALEDSEGRVPDIACPENLEPSTTATDLVAEDTASIQTAPPVPTTTEDIQTTLQVPTSTEAIVSIQTAPNGPFSMLSSGTVSTETMPAISPVP